MYVEMKNIYKQYGDFRASDNVSFGIEKGRLVALLGPSGSGKTTLLRMIAGLETPNAGDIYIDGRRVNDIPASKRGIGFVFQSYALFPHYNVFDNVAYGLKLRKLDKKVIHDKVMEILDLVELSGMEGRMTNQLSGGQQQRVALARALVVEPSVLLFDEPLSNLDAKLRVSMRTEIRNIQQRVGITAVYVTHDQSEAMALSDQIIIMNKGVVSQIGTPQEIYYHPADEFVADFIGEANFLRGRLVQKDGEKGVLSIDNHDVEVDDIGSFEVGSDCTVVLRPEAAVLAPEGQLPCKVVMSCFMGEYQNYHVMAGDTLVKITDFNPKHKRIYRLEKKPLSDLIPVMYTLYNRRNQVSG